MSTIKISPGERYYDRFRDSELIVMDVIPTLNQVIIQTEGIVQEIRSLAKFLAGVRRGSIVSVEEPSPTKSNNEKR